MTGRLRYELNSRGQRRVSDHEKPVPMPLLILYAESRSGASLHFQEDAVSKPMSVPAECHGVISKCRVYVLLAALMMISCQGGGHMHGDLDLDVGSARGSNKTAVGTRQNMHALHLCLQQCLV